MKDEGRERQQQQIDRVDRAAEQRELDRRFREREAIAEMSGQPAEPAEEERPAPKE